MEAFNPEIKRDDEIAIDFVYSVASELDRVRDTVARRDFFKEHGYHVSLPKNTTFENFDDFSQEELAAKVESEMDVEKAATATETIQKSWQINQETLKEFFLTLGEALPGSYTIVFTRYGTGGSYYPPDKIIINLNNSSNLDPFQIFIHEAIHNLIEESVVQKHKLTQPEKESLVDYLMITSPVVQLACPDKKKYQKFGPPSAELLERVGWTERPTP